METDAKRMQLLLDLLAWVIVGSVPSAHQALPEAEVFRDPLLWALAQRDPLLFDLARLQVALALEHWADDEARSAAVWLLRAARPARRWRGDNLGRDVLIYSAVLLAEEAGLWPDARRPRNRAAVPVEGINWEALATPEYSVSGASRKLHELLSVHWLIEDKGGAVPSDAAIRAAIVRGPDLLRALGAGQAEGRCVLASFCALGPLE